MLKNRKTLTAIITALLIASAVSAQSDRKLDIKSLEGNWEGVGWFLVPLTELTMAVEGKADFRYNEKEGYLRTALTGEKYLFTYSDSGRLIHNVKTDSVSWEVWDNLGHHSRYLGAVDGNVIKGSRKYKKDVYDVVVEVVTTDSIDFKLTRRQPGGEAIEQAVFNLWRVKD